MASILFLSNSPFAHAPVVGYIVAAHTVFTLCHTGIGVLGASASDLCNTFCNCNRWPQLFPVKPTVYSCTCGDIHCAGTNSVLRRASTSTGVLRARVFASAGPFATATGSSILSLSCSPSTLALVVEHIAPAPAVYAAPAPVMVHLVLAQAVSYAAQAQVLEYFAPASSASAGPFATATGSSFLSLSCSPPPLALVVEYFAPAPAVYAAPAPVCCTSRWHEQCLSRRNFSTGLSYDWVRDLARCLSLC